MGPEQLAFTVDGLLSAERCRALIERGEALGFADAPITTAAGFVMRPDIRNNTRVMFDDLDLAAELHALARPFVPAAMGPWNLCGVNERFRIYRYRPGQQFAAHYDGAFLRDENERSLLTFMVYLNEGFDGGETWFPRRGVQFVPAVGRALFFEHQQLHEGVMVYAGVKYALRTDVMYRRG